MRWFLVTAAALVGCAEAHPIPTQAMAKAAIELHVAEQQGARYGIESAELCQRAEDSLERARRSAFRGRSDEARAAAEDGYAYARKARALSRGTPAASARELQTVASTLGGAAPKIAITAPAVR